MGVHKANQHPYDRNHTDADFFVSGFLSRLAAGGLSKPLADSRPTGGEALYVRWVNLRVEGSFLHKITAYASAVMTMTIAAA